MLTDEEIVAYTDLYFNYGVDIKNEIQNYKWQTLAKFLVQWRSGDVKRDDPLFQIWLAHIAPSCVYTKICFADEKADKFYTCFFCPLKMFKRTAYLIRHYREAHYEAMPPKIFGENIIFKCIECNIEFTRKEYLTIHKQSEKHLKALDPGALAERKRHKKCEITEMESEAFYKKTKHADSLTKKDEDFENVSNTSLNSVKVEEATCKNDRVKLKILALGLEDEQDCNEVSHVPQTSTPNPDHKSTNKGLDEEKQDESQKTQPIDHEYPERSVRDSDKDSDSECDKLEDELQYSSFLKIIENAENSNKIKNTEHKLVKVLSSNLEQNLKF